MQVSTSNSYKWSTERRPAAMVEKIGMKPRCEVCDRTTFVQTLRNGAQICGLCQDIFRAVFRIQRRPCKHLPKTRSKPRRGPRRDRGYRKWLNGQLCCVLDRWESYFQGCCDQTSSDPAHTQNNGTSSKGPDSSCVPLCRKHHREYDAGRKAFEHKYGLNMRKIAAEYYAEYLKEKC